MIQEKLQKLIREAFDEIGVTVESIDLEHPSDPSHGDVATNAALISAKQTEKKPHDLAEVVVEKLHRIEDSDIEKIEVAGPGFINFFLSKKFFRNSLKEIGEKNDSFGSSTALSGKKVMIEYTDPNPFKEMHIGHLMSNAIGESISRIIVFSGAEVKRANYQGDVGLHVAKAIWGKMQNPEEEWKKVYALGASEYEKHKEEIDKLNKKIYGRSDPEVNKLYEEGKKESLKSFEELYALLGTRFDFYFLESDSGPIGLDFVKKHPDIFEESSGAVVFRGEKFDPTLHTRVFITSEGLPTYEAKELGLAKMKHDSYPHDVSIVITGNEVKDYFRVVHKAMENVFPDFAKKTKHIPHGMLRLAGGKMSSRTGDVISAKELLLEVQSRIFKRSKESDLSEKEKKEIAMQVAVGAVKYSILKQSAGNDIVFNFEKSLSFEGDSGPYLQYTHARMRSVLRKGVKEHGINPEVPDESPSSGSLERMLYRFPEVVERALLEYEPHYVTTYLTELAGVFNTLYEKERIVDAGEKAPYRLALTQATATALKNGLYLLGIAAPERI